MRIDPRFGAKVTRVNGVPIEASIAPPAADPTAPGMASDAARLTRGVRTTLPWSKTRLTKPLDPELDPDQLTLSDPWKRAKRRLQSQTDDELLQDTHDQLDQLLKDLEQKGLQDHPQYQQLARLRDSLARLRKRRDQKSKQPKPGDEPTGLDGWDTLLGMILGPGATLKQAQERYRQGLAQARAGKSLEAIRLLKKAIAGDPDHVDAHAKLGQLLLDAGRYPEAEQHLQLAASYRPRDYRLQLGLGELYYHLSEHELARQAFFDASQLGPTHSDPHAWLGVMAYESGHLSDAAGSLEKAVQLDPGNAVARFYLAQVALQLNDPLRAAFQIKMVQQLQPLADLSRFKDHTRALPAAVTAPLERYRWRSPNKPDA
jgi:tetratricopeptide (TPR) repeat protein